MGKHSQVYIPHSSDKTFYVVDNASAALAVYIPHSSDKTIVTLFTIAWNKNGLHPS